MKEPPLGVPYPKYISLTCLNPLNVPNQETQKFPDAFSIHVAPHFVHPSRVSQFRVLMGHRVRGHAIENALQVFNSRGQQNGPCE